MVAVLSEWWLFYLSGGWCDHCGHIPADNYIPIGKLFCIEIPRALFFRVGRRETNV